MRRWMLGIGMVWLGLTWLVGCSPKARGDDCTRDDDCGAGEACLAGICEQVQCRVDGDCAAGQVCLEYTCVLEGSCTSDGQCALGTICVDGACAPGCRVDGDCPDASVCEPDLGANGQCVDCRWDGDCADSERCVENTCRAECTGDPDCPGGHCDPLSSTCVECLQDAQCDPLEICLANVCQTGCRQDDACPQGQICVAQQCRPGCRDDQDCPQGQTCDQTLWICQSVGCTSSGDCQPGQVCIDQQCVAGCTGNRDCPQGQVCDQNSGAHGQCVDCLLDGDCPPAHTCQDRTCVPVAGECELQIVPSEPVQFGDLPLGGLAARSFQLTNLGAGGCQVSSILLREASAAGVSNFGLAFPPPLPVALAPAGLPGAALVIEVLFAPSAIGAHAATLWLETDDLELTVGQDQPACNAVGVWTPGAACVPLSGTASAGCDELVAIPTALIFGQVVVGCDSLDQRVRIYNLGQVARTINGLSLGAADPSPFELLAPPALPVLLQPGQRLELSLRYRASAAGLQVDNLQVRTAMANCVLAVPLLGVGVADAAAEDVFVQPASPLVDVLWVVDNSGSMQPIQDALASAAVEFIRWAVQIGLDFQIGVVTTDMSDPTQSGRLQGDPLIITPTTSNPEGAFAANVQVGTMGSGYEMGLAASLAALAEPLRSGHNAGFVRDRAKLNVIWVSDEEDQSPWTIDLYADFFIHLKGYLELIDLSAVVGDAPDGCESFDGNIYADAGLRYLALVDDFYGMFQSVCDPDWTALWQHLGMTDLAPQRSFVLSRPAIENTLVVTVDGHSVPPASQPFGANGWTFSDLFNALWFGDQVVPSFGATLVVRYSAACL